MKKIKRVFFVTIIFFLFSLLALAQSPVQRLPASQLDYESQQCMKCHNGSGGKLIELRPVDAPIEFEKGLWMRTKNHSIGMSYSDSRMKNPQEYVPLSKLDVKVKLIDGKVGCLSCHIAKPQYLASLSAEVNLEPQGCTLDKEESEKAFQGNLCMKCHIK